MMWSGATSATPIPTSPRSGPTAPVSTGSFIDHDLLPEGIEVGEDWIIYRYDDCSRVLRDAKTFSSAGYDATIAWLWAT